MSERESLSFALASMMYAVSVIITNVCRVFSPTHHWEHMEHAGECLASATSPMSSLRCSYGCCLLHSLTLGCESSCVLAIWSNKFSLIGDNLECVAGLLAQQCMSGLPISLHAYITFVFLVYSLRITFVSLCACMQLMGQEKQAARNQKPK